MAKIIFKCTYLRNGLKTSKHLANYIKYIAKRDGVEKLNENSEDFVVATIKQKNLINSIIRDFPESKTLFEYKDFIENSTRKNASEFINMAIETFMDVNAKKENYIKYIASRPRTEKIETHGLFSFIGEKVDLNKVANEVASHEGIVWCNIISLRREDAERLGYNNAHQWQILINSLQLKLAENFKIKQDNFKWYAAFHNESHHPHVHLVIYSQKTGEGYVTKDAILKIRSILANQIFRQELIEIYSEQTEKRNMINESSREKIADILAHINSGIYVNKKIEVLLTALSKRLENYNGKKQYGYLKASEKNIVDEIVDEIEKDEKIKELYSLWMELRQKVVNTYRDSPLPEIPLKSQKEFRQIKNSIIKEALKINSVYIDETDKERLDGTSKVMENDIDIQMDDITPEISDWTEKYREARTYLYGIDTTIDFIRAFNILKEEAENGNAFAFYDLGTMYEKGLGVKMDIDEAQNFFKKSFNGLLLSVKGIEKPYIYYRLGKMYRDGLGVEQSYKKAAEMFHKAEKNQYAQYLLAKQYINKGENLEKTIEYLTDAAVAGNQYAELLLKNLNDYSSFQIITSVSNLTKGIAKMLEDGIQNYQSPKHTESKLLEKIRRKKILQGQKINMENL